MSGMREEPADRVCLNYQMELNAACLILDRSESGKAWTDVASGSRSEIAATRKIMRCIEVKV